MKNYEQLVGYLNLDPFKKLCLKAGIQTSESFKHPFIKELFSSRGESAHVMEFPEWFTAFVLEGLGTKNVAADRFLMQLAAQDMDYSPNGRTYYDAVALTTIAMIVNDLITVGALPYQINMYAAVGNSSWFENEQRVNDLVEGFKKGCLLSGAVWGGGETPSLRDIINPDTIDLGGAANGLIWPKSNLITSENISSGDDIVFVESSGIHGNGWTFIRELAETLPDKYLTKLASGEVFGEALLKPTHIYVEFMRFLFEASIVPHYAVNVTGHGFRKLMRANETFKYVVDVLPEPQEVFTFIQNTSGKSNEEMYKTFNMGVGFAIYVDPTHTPTAIECAAKAGFKAWRGGFVVNSDTKSVELRPLNLTYTEETLNIR